MPAISIIVPVYKAEKYLHRCVDSILAQTFTDFEVLLIDDGSPDKSGQICDEYAKIDPRIRVFHKENGGVSSARQCGIDNASGEYTIHVDPDDWVDHDMLELLYFSAINEDADIVICDYFWEKNSTAKHIEQRPTSIDNDSVIKDLFGHLHGSLWNKLIKLKCCKKNNLTFVDGINLYEDLIFNIKLLLSQPLKISYVNQAFYHYMQYENTNSLSRKYNNDTLQQDFYIRDYILSILKNEDYKERCVEYFNTMIIQRAFFSGYYTGYEFKKLFFKIRYFVFKSHHFNTIVKFALYFSCIGFYKPIYWLMNYFRNKAI